MVFAAAPALALAGPTWLEFWNHVGLGERLGLGLSVLFLVWVVRVLWAPTAPVPTLLRATPSRRRKPRSGRHLATSAAASAAARPRRGSGPPARAARG